jgi:hypothetical protein
LQVWDLTTGTAALRMDEYVSCATVYRAADGNYHAILAGHGGKLRVYDLGVRAQLKGPTMRSAVKTG